MLASLLLFLLAAMDGVAQSAYVKNWTTAEADSMKIALAATDNDTLKMKIARRLGMLEVINR